MYHRTQRLRLTTVDAMTRLDRPELLMAGRSSVLAGLSHATHLTKCCDSRRSADDVKCGLLFGACRWYIWTEALRVLCPDSSRKATSTCSEVSSFGIAHPNRLGVIGHELQPIKPMNIYALCQLTPATLEQSLASGISLFSRNEPHNLEFCSLPGLSSIALGCSRNRPSGLPGAQQYARACGDHGKPAARVFRDGVGHASWL